MSGRDVTKAEEIYPKLASTGVASFIREIKFKYCEKIDLC